MSALCHRKLLNFGKAKIMFSIINREIRRKQRQAIKHAIFSVFSLPFQVERTSVLEHLTALTGIQDFFAKTTPQSPPKSPTRSP